MKDGLFSVLVTLVLVLMGGGLGVLVQYVCACVTTVFGYDYRIYFYLHITAFIPATYSVGRFSYLL